MSRRRAAVAVVVLALAVGSATVPVARAQDQPDPSREVLAVVSPLANPVCNAAGASTLLVPILGGVAAEQLALGEQIDVGDVVLDSLGPVFVTCGSLPAPDGTRCEVIDDQVFALWPEDLSGAGLTAPSLGGNLVEGLGRAARLLGLDIADLTEAPLRCSLPTETESPEAPPAPPPPALSPATAPPVATQPGTASAAPPLGPATAPTPLPSSLDEIAAPATPTPVSSTMTVTDVVARSVPTGVVLLQLLAAAALLAFLGTSWARSALEARRIRSRPRSG